MSFSYDNFRKSLRFTAKGRSTRSEYWSFFGFSWIYLFILGALLSFTKGVFPKTIWEVLLIVFIGFGIFIAVIHFFVMVRRLHDTGKSGWWVGGYYILMFLANSGNDFFSLLFFIFWIVMLVFLCTKSDAIENKYGPCPIPVVEKNKAGLEGKHEQQ